MRFTAKEIQLFLDKNGAMASPYLNEFGRTALNIIDQQMADNKSLKQVLRDIKRAHGVISHSDIAIANKKADELLGNE